MPYAVPLTHVRIEGTYGTLATDEVEIWSFGFYVSGALLPEGYLAAGPALWDAAAAYIGNSATGATFAPEVWLKEVMAASVEADGTLSAGYYSRYAESPVKGVGATLFPWTLSSCVTLDAGKPAPGRFNRFYPPAQNGLPQNGLLAETTAQARADAAWFLVNNSVTALEAIGTAAFQGVVASARYGTNRPIDSVKVGRRLDQQRRRSNAIPEQYMVTPYVP